VEKNRSVLFWKKRNRHLNLVKERLAERLKERKVKDTRVYQQIGGAPIEKRIELAAWV